MDPKRKLLKWAGEGMQSRKEPDKDDSPVFLLLILSRTCLLILVLLSRFSALKQIK